jgi:hypothetical protein
MTWALVAAPFLLPLLAIATDSSDILVRRIALCLETPMGAVEANAQVDIAVTFDSAGRAKRIAVMSYWPQNTVGRQSADAVVSAVGLCGPYAGASGLVTLTFDMGNIHGDGSAVTGPQE